MNSKAFITKALNRFVFDITDKVFLLIQNDKDLLRDYIVLITAAHGKSTQDSIQQTNEAIGKAIKEIFSLGNVGREENPQSSLIRSYEKHSLKNGK